jgi:hypothetical protein
VNLQLPKPPIARVNGWGASGIAAKPRLLSSAQWRRMRLQLADLDAKLRRMTAAEHERRR